MFDTCQYVPQPLRPNLNKLRFELGSTQLEAVRLQFYKSLSLLIDILSFEKDWISIWQKYDLVLPNFTFHFYFSSNFQLSQLSYNFQISTNFQISFNFQFSSNLISSM